MPSTPPTAFSPDLIASIRTAARLISASTKTVALTGAGLSVESGIPPFKGTAGTLVGLWERYDPELYATIEAFDRDPGRVWVMLAELGGVIRRARPNAGHLALARLENEGRLAAVITQNVDGLHQEAGSSAVIEFHGNWRSMSCRRCGQRRDSRDVSLDRLPPRCGCGGPLKPDVTLYGEIIPSGVIDAACELARRCEVLLVVGTSGEVAPASSIPWTAREAGATIIEINTGRTALGASAVDLRLEGPAGLILPALAGALGTTTEN